MGHSVTLVNVGQLGHSSSSKRPPLHCMFHQLCVFCLYSGMLSSKALSLRKPFLQATIRVNSQPTRLIRPICMAAPNTKLDKSTPEEIWKTILTAEEYRILRQKGTEAAGSGTYNKFYEEGTYVCAGCGTALYKSETKFNSGCGWPAFYEEMPGAVDRIEDNTYGMKRIEITCKNCGGHLGHVFEGEGFPTPTNARHCVNSASIKFKASN